jgi:AAA15 family ATPase/GTPase
MKNKTDLYLLIHSMSKTEKRYFTMDAQKSGRRSSRYLELFQAINQMDPYDEARLQKKFGRSLPTDKHYLYEAILRSIRDYRSSKSRAAQIKHMILDANYLYERGLYQQSEARLEQAKELAAELDDQLALLEITREQLNYVWTMKKKDFGQQIDQLLADKDQYIQNINEELKYLSLAYQIQMMKDQPGSGPALRSAEINGRLFGEEHYPSAAHAQRRFLQSAAVYYDLQEQFSRANEYYTKMVDWWDTYPNIKREEYIRYLADLFNLLHASYYQKQYKQFEEILRKIEQEEPSSYHDQQLIFKQLTNYQLLYHINLGILEGYEQLLERVEHGMSAYKLNPFSQLIIAFNLSVLLFVLQQYSLCQHWADQVLRVYNRKVDSQQFRCSTLLISLLSAYSDDNLDLTDSSARALQRALRHEEAPAGTAFFTLCLQFTRKLSNALPEEQTAILQDFSGSIQTLTQEEKERIPLGMDDLVQNWIDSQAQRRPLYRLLREKAAAE